MIQEPGNYSSMGLIEMKGSHTRAQKCPCAAWVNFKGAFTGKFPWGLCSQA